MDDIAPENSCMQRAKGKIVVAMANHKIKQLYQSGAAKVLLPRTHGSMPEAVLVNTAGGITGGDRFSYQVATENSELVVTTQAAERAYRSASETASLSVKLTARNGSALHWLPQETILFDGCSLRRNVEVDIDASSECLMLEALTYGRHAMKETLNDCLFSDQWRIRQAGQLVHAEALRLESAVSDMLRQIAGGASAQMSATLIYLGPRLDNITSNLKTVFDRVSSLAAFSAWQDKLVVRLLSNEAHRGREDIIEILNAMREHDLPRVWQ